MIAGWRAWTEDNNDLLLDSESNDATTGRPVWIQGILYYANIGQIGSAQDYDVNADITGDNGGYQSPLFPYVGRNTQLFRCPGDETYVLLPVAYNGLPPGSKVPRVRSISMSQVFSRGEWLEGNYNPSGPLNWRTYNKGGQIVVPARTFVFLDEHPTSINDGAFASSCGANQPTDSGGKYIDFPGTWHSGACGISFADGHVEIHKWRGIFTTYSESNVVPLNHVVTDPASIADCHWLAQMSTVAK